MTIRIKKGADDRTALSCIHADGTTTWQRSEGHPARFFPHHDLTHYAVERVLGFREGFYGLVSSGWDLADFGSPWPRGKIPPQAGIVEMIVGFFDLERRSGENGSAADLNRMLAEYSAERGLPPERQLTEEDLAAVRTMRAELLTRWAAVERGKALEVIWTATAN